MSPTIVLISGANRGLGKALLERYLARPEHIVIAANRNPEHTTSEDLEKLPKGSGSRLIQVKVDGNSDSDSLDAVKKLQDQGIDHLDIVIANAGVMYAVGKVSDVKIADIQGHFEPNVYGVIRLYQATLPLLLKSTNPKWITMGSGAGFIENQYPVPNAAYAPSKIAAHWLTKRINGEEEKLTAFVMNPGWVQTEMGNTSAVMFGFEVAPQTLEESVDGMMKVFDAADKESYGGRMWSYEGKQEAW